MSERRRSVQRLLDDVHWAMANGLGQRDLVPMLENLLSRAEGGSPASVFAKRQLAELIVPGQPWRAAALCREVLAHYDDDRAWAILGLAHTLLGHYHAAAKAYRRAIALTPDSPYYAHNLGHLLDVALNRPHDALTYLSAAYRAEEQEVEIAASYAHALARDGQLGPARRILCKALERSDEEVDALLDDWLGRDPPGSLPDDGRDAEATPAACCDEDDWPAQPDATAPGLLPDDSPTRQRSG